VEPILEAYLLEDKFQRNGMMYYQEETGKYFIFGYTYVNESDLFQFDPKTEAVETFRIDFKMNDFYILNEQALLLGGYDANNNYGVLKEYDLKTKTLKKVFNDIKEIRSVNYFPKLGEYWIGSIEGLYVLDRNYKEKYVFNRHQNQRKRIISEDHIRNIILYNGKIITGSLGGGIYIINPATYEVENQISDFNGLSDNKAIGLIEDDLGNCWISTFNGLNVMDKSFNIIRKFQVHEGLPDREFNTKSVIKDNDGMLYFGSLNGIAKVDPEKMLQWETTHGVSIDEVHAFSNKGQSQLLLDDFEIYDSTDSLVVNFSTPDYYIYPFSSSATNFVDSTNTLQFSNQVNKSTLSNFTKGKFKVNSILANNSISDGFELEVQKDNRALWKILGLILGVFGLAFLISKVVIGRNKIAEEQKTAVNKKIAEIQLSALRSQMNPHFIFNALGAIQYFIQTQNVEKADEYLSDFAMLMRKILESSKGKFISLHEELQILKLYIGLEKVRFDHIFDYKIEVDPNINQESRIPPMIIQPFVENAINHGLFNLKDRKGLLKIEFKAQGEEDILCIIRDNGVGRKKAAELRMKTHKSRGMQIVNERVETIKKAGEMQIEIDTKDLFDQSSPSGTEIRIILTPL
jgi:two-component sensor histidine kinase